MNNYDIFGGFIEIIVLGAFFFLCYSIYKMQKEQKKTVMLLRKIYELNGGQLLQYEKDELDE